MDISFFRLYLAKIALYFKLNFLKVATRLINKEKLIYREINNCTWNLYKVNNYNRGINLESINNWREKRKLVKTGYILSVNFIDLWIFL